MSATDTLTRSRPTGFDGSGGRGRRARQTPKGRQVDLDALSFPELKKLAAAGALDHEDQVWTEGYGSWVEAVAVIESDLMGER